ncbi:helix-turn-helix domain-containing protein [Virgibacillus ndiopensis]|uniref:helix-turn-helix domain-containing protein n=1 Tax=Virgibacillus ndiopensis TaxID=2004408 RepID=UPI000C07D522|nr:helix-turn-helix transcriptional regulator [Virgibacillus ndiopensis]
MPAIYIDSYDFQYLKKCSLGERLRFFRQQMIQHHGSDYTITSLGSRIGVTPQSISAIERGDSKKPSFQLVHNLTQEYRVPLESVTDEFYIGKETLFTIGIPDDPIIIDDEDFEFEETEEENVVIDDEDENYFDFDDTKGILLYHCLNRNEIEPIYHTHFKEDISDDEMKHLISMLLLETTSLSKENFEGAKAVHPLQEAHQIINRYNKFLSADELLNLLVNKKSK